MAVPMFINTGVKKHVPDSPFVATDGKGFAGDIQLWEPGESENPIFSMSAVLTPARLVAILLSESRSGLQG